MAAREGSRASLRRSEGVPLCQAVNGPGRLGEGLLGRVLFGLGPDYTVCFPIMITYTASQPEIRAS
jgi:hypothetical protein